MPNSTDLVTMCSSSCIMCSSSASARSDSVGWPLVCWAWARPDIGDFPGDRSFGRMLARGGAISRWPEGARASSRRGRAPRDPHGPRHGNFSSFAPTTRSGRRPCCCCGLPSLPASAECSSRAASAPRGTRRTRLRSAGRSPRPKRARWRACWSAPGATARASPPRWSATTRATTPSRRRGSRPAATRSRSARSATSSTGRRASTWRRARPPISS